MHIYKLKITTFSILAGILLSGSALAALPAGTDFRPAADIASPLDAPDIDEEIPDDSDSRDTSSVPVEEMTPAEFAAVADLSVPSNFSFVLDPLNISGNGQIQSGQYVFENNGSLDLEVTIDKIYYQFPNDVDFRSITSSELLDLGSETKDLYLYIEQAPSQENEGEGSRTILTNNPEATTPITFVLTADKSSLDNKAVFTLGGGASQGANIWWEDGDIQIIAVYTYTIYDADIIDLDELEAETATPLDADKLEASPELEEETPDENRVDGPAGDIPETSANVPEDTEETTLPSEDSSAETTLPPESSTEAVLPESSSAADPPSTPSEAPEETEVPQESGSEASSEPETAETDSVTEIPETAAASNITNTIP